jgi:hypothetical protein
MVHSTKRVLGVLAVAGALALASVPASAQVNGGFETGDTTGWTDNGGPLGVVGAWAEVGSGGPVYTPVEGNFFAVMGSGLGTGVYSTIEQTVALSAGQWIGGYAFFDAGDYIPFNDDAYVQITQGNVVLYSQNVAGVGDFGYGPWTAFGYNAPTAGLYTIQAGVRNNLDNILTSYIGLDGVSTVPEPGSLALLGAGALPFAMRLRRRSKKA